jgi:hypothetical protein
LCQEARKNKKRQICWLPFCDGTHHKLEKLLTACAVCYPLFLGLECFLHHFVVVLEDQHVLPGSVSVEEEPCRVHQPQAVRWPSLDRGRVHYSSQLRSPIVRPCYVACLATRYLPCAYLHHLQRASELDGHSMRRESCAPRPVKDNCGSDLQEGLVGGSHPSPSFVWMNSMTNNLGPRGREGRGRGAEEATTSGGVCFTAPLVMGPGNLAKVSQGYGRICLFD